MSIPITPNKDKETPIEIQIKVEKLFKKPLSLNQEFRDYQFKDMDKVKIQTLPEEFCTQLEKIDEDFQQNLITYIIPFKEFHFVKVYSPNKQLNQDDLIWMEDIQIRIAYCIHFKKLIPCLIQLLQALTKLYQQSQVPVLIASFERIYNSQKKDYDYHLNFSFLDKNERDQQQLKLMIANTLGLFISNENIMNLQASVSNWDDKIQDPTKLSHFYYESHMYNKGGSKRGVWSTPTKTLNHNEQEVLLAFTFGVYGCQNGNTFNQIHVSEIEGIAEFQTMTKSIIPQVMLTLMEWTWLIEKRNSGMATSVLGIIRSVKNELKQSRALKEEFCKISPKIKFTSQIVQTLSFEYFESKSEISEAFGIIALLFNQSQISKPLSKNNQDKPQQSQSEQKSHQHSLGEVNEKNINEKPITKNNNNSWVPYVWTNMENLIKQELEHKKIVHPQLNSLKYNVPQLVARNSDIFNIQMSKLLQRAEHQLTKQGLINELKELTICCKNLIKFNEEKIEYTQLFSEQQLISSLHAQILGQYYPSTSFDGNKIKYLGWTGESDNPFSGFIKTSKRTHPWLLTFLILTRSRTGKTNLINQFRNLRLQNYANLFLLNAKNDYAHQIKQLSNNKFTICVQEELLSSQEFWEHSQNMTGNEVGISTFDGKWQEMIQLPPTVLTGLSNYTLKEITDKLKDKGWNDERIDALSNRLVILENFDFQDEILVFFKYCLNYKDFKIVQQFRWLNLKQVIVPIEITFDKQQPQLTIGNRCKTSFTDKIFNWVQIISDLSERQTFLTETIQERESTQITKIHYSWLRDSSILITSFLKYINSLLGPKKKKIIGINEDKLINDVNKQNIAFLIYHCIQTLDSYYTSKKGVIINKSLDQSKGQQTVIQGLITKTPNYPTQESLQRKTAEALYKLKQSFQKKSVKSFKIKDDSVYSLTVINQIDPNDIKTLSKFAEVMSEFINFDSTFIEQNIQNYKALVVKLESDEQKQFLINDLNLKNFQAWIPTLKAIMIESIQNYVNGYEQSIQSQSNTSMEDIDIHSKSSVNFKEPDLQKQIKTNPKSQSVMSIESEPRINNIDLIADLGCIEEEKEKINEQIDQSQSDSEQEQNIENPEANQDEEEAIALLKSEAARYDDEEPQDNGC